ncbi:MAG: glycosyltransferase family 2 protein [Armatimonadetes bacterium]|nr:glycosyltransferase family 2 protein [Armatimonadota bacterium]
MRKTPLALFTYNRPQYTRSAMEALARCRRLEECEVFVFCDGPKTLEHASAVEESRRAAHELAPAVNATVVERPENFGLARSIVETVTALCADYGRVIVLEDDLTAHPRFVDYMLQALERYENDHRVYQVSGFMFPVSHPPGPDAFLMPLSTTVGWATWERAWKAFDPQPTDWEADLRDAEFRGRLDLDGACDFSDMLRQRMNGGNQSWGVLWYYALVKARALVAQPRRSLIYVGGFDNSGVHCGAPSPIYKHDRDTLLSQEFPERFVFSDAEDEHAFLRVKAFLAAQKPGPIRRLGSSLRQRARSAFGALRAG